jgi:DNA-binding CsgD family transcriptional regulator
MSHRASNSAIKLSALSKMEEDRKGLPLLNINAQLRELNESINININFEKPQFIDFFGNLLADYILRRLNFITPEGEYFNNILSITDKDNFLLDKINRLKALSERQLEVFERLLRDLSNYEISRELNIKVNTVKSHLNEVYLKLGVPNRYVAIAQYRDLFIKLRKISSET